MRGTSLWDKVLAQIESQDKEHELGLSDQVKKLNLVLFGRAMMWTMVITFTKGDTHLLPTLINPVSQDLFIAELRVGGRLDLLVSLDQTVLGHLSEPLRRLCMSDAKPREILQLLTPLIKAYIFDDE